MIRSASSQDCQFDDPAGMWQAHVNVGNRVKAGSGYRMSAPEVDAPLFVCKRVTPRSHAAFDAFGKYTYC
jgi:hypothetical protein